MSGLPWWRPEPLGPARAALAPAMAYAQEIAQALDGARTHADAWSGASAEAAEVSRTRLVAQSMEVTAAVARFDTALWAATDGLTAVAGLVEAAEATARWHGLVLTEAGLVVDPTGEATAARPQVEALLAEARRLAYRVDDDLSRELRAVSTQVSAVSTGLGASPDLPVTSPMAWAGSAVSAVDAVDAVNAVNVVPPDSGRAADPAATRAWWDGLTSSEQADQITGDPALVGTADGLPAWARDRANRILLDRAEPALEAETAALSPPRQTFADILGGAGGLLTVGTFGGGARRLAYRQALDKLAAVRATRQVLAQRDGRVRQLVVFDTSGRQAKVAVCVGDMDGAERVAVVVAGFTTTVHRDLAGADRMAADLAGLSSRQAAAVSDRREVAVVTWLGYDTPQLADTFHSRQSVVLRLSAEAGGTSLATFLKGIGPTRRLTLIGHSYGSTTAGVAVARGGTGVDDLVALGSPGLGVSTIDALGLPAGRVHVIEADDDPVADLGWFGRDPDHLGGVDRLSADSTTLPDGGVGLRSAGHSSYLTAGTTSQWNVAAVVAGGASLPARVTARGTPPEARLPRRPADRRPVPR